MPGPHKSYNAGSNPVARKIRFTHKAGSQTKKVLFDSKATSLPGTLLVSTEANCVGCNEPEPFQDLLGFRVKEAPNVSSCLIEAMKEVSSAVHCSCGQNLGSEHEEGETMFRKEWDLNPWERNAPPN